MRTRPDAITEMNVGSRTVARDEQGFLIDPDEWDEKVAAALAAEQNLTLTKEHWAIFQFMRAFLAEHGVAADARFVFRFLDERGDPAKSGKEKFFELFPYGYVGQACKISGMRQPRAWSTG
ncbi:MAG: TusE/DsrC/DsvC family sulfur relay protein [Hyphomicrobiaceae bacterium]|nr:TusE/DsrC/DsvC family sulfur relay protein [Hyphomicrobiaceae bacterium]